VDADELPLVDSAASFVLKKLTWANLKATLKTYLDTLYASVSGAAFDPATMSVLYEEFQQAYGTSTNVGTAYVATSAFSSAIVYTGGAGVSISLGAALDAPGYITVSTGSTSGGFSRVCTTAGNLIQLGGGETRIKQRIRIPVLATTAQNFFVQCGLFDGITGAGNVLRAICQDGVNSGKWTLDTIIGGGAATVVNTSIAPVANTWTTIEIVVNPAGTSATLFIDGVSAATISPLPTAAMAHFTYMIKSAGTTARTLDVDYHYIKQTITR
jgi:hypothetical protein